MNMLINRGEIYSTVLAVHPVGEFGVDDRASVELSETVMQYETANTDADHGWIDGLPVVHVTKSADGHIHHHHLGERGQFQVGQQVQIKRDADRHDLLIRSICAGRLLELVGRSVYPYLIGIAADYRVNRSKVQFSAHDFIPESKAWVTDFYSQTDRLIALDLPIRNAAPTGDDCIRSVQIGDFPPFRCRVAYPSSLRQIGKLRITRIVANSGLEVRYRVEDRTH